MNTITDNPLVSIIVPVYNAANFIQDLLQSINCQNCDYEAIFIDDGSIDSSRDIIQTFAQQNPKIRYFYQPNAGASRARAKGITKAKGHWITFVDADDIISKNFSAICNQKCQQYTGDIIVTSTDVTPPPPEDIELNQQEYTRNIISQKLHTGPWAKFFRKDLFDAFIFDMPCDIISAEDYIMNIRLALRANNGVLIIRQSFYKIRRDVNPQSAMKTFKGSIEYNRLYYKCFKASFDLGQWEIYLPEIIGRFYIIWYHDHRKQWILKENAINNECFKDIKKNLFCLPYKPSILMQLNWKLRNPILRFLLDMIIRVEGSYKRYIKSHFNI